MLEKNTIDRVVQKTKKLTALYVEDEKETQTQIGKLLDNFFEKTLMAQNGIEALECIKGNPIDVLFCDLSMPQMDGFELILHLHRRELNIPVIIISAHDEQSVYDALYHQGIIGFLTKPVCINRLVTLLEQLDYDYDTRKTSKTA